MYQRIELNHLQVIFRTKQFNKEITKEIPTENWPFFAGRSLQEFKKRSVKHFMVCYSIMFVQNVCFCKSMKGKMNESIK